ncbi:hypothetical protein K0M31_007992 [Melipona bicolor]|uniref:Uncharacterized protein n=1 Tax=Melipona bicolor TaxID=60889 RepID=A0AA40GCQ1_9HYME|nr:hypothetical protein K0M31_007992 [Melipona bicolor]
MVVLAGGCGGGSGRQRGSDVHPPPPSPTPFQATSGSVLGRRPVVVAQAHFTPLPFSPHQRLGHVVTSDPRWDRHDRATGQVGLGRGSNWIFSDSSVFESRRTVSQNFRQNFWDPSPLQPEDPCNYDRWSGSIGRPSVDISPDVEFATCSCTARLARELWEQSLVSTFFLFSLSRERLVTIRRNSPLVFDRFDRYLVSRRMKLVRE